MTDFNFGDRVAISPSDPDAEQNVFEGWVEPANMDGTGDRLVFVNTVNGDEVDPKAFTLDTMLEDPAIVITLVKPLSESLPTVPGKYYDQNELDQIEVFKLMGLIQEGDEEATPAVWTLDEFGVWTDFTGASRPSEYNWVLAHGNFQPVPVA